MPRDPNATHSSTKDKGHLRRRAADTESSGTLLPSSFYPSIQSPPLKRNGSRNLPLYTSPGTSTCNSFLLGGQYYPGKDKKRRHMRKKTLWHRIFCSSPLRMGCSAILCAYLLLWIVLVPLTQALLDYGRILSGGVTKHLDRTSSFTLPSLEEQKIFSQHLQEARHRIQHQQKHKAQLKILEKIVPEWFHRNDAAPLDVDEDERQHSRERHQRDAKELDNSHFQSKDVRDGIVKSRNVTTLQIQEDQEETIPKVVHTIASNNSIKELEVDSAKMVSKKTQNPLDPTKDEGIANSAEQPVGQIAAKVQTLETDKPVIATKPKEKQADANETYTHSMIVGSTSIQKKKHELGNDEGLDQKNTSMTQTSAKSIDKVVVEMQSVQRTLLNTDQVPNQSNCPMNLFPESLATTLVVQCSLDRMWILKETCLRWKDPIVVVTYNSPFENSPNLTEWNLSCPQMKVISYPARKEDQVWGYPVNQLRNLGLDAVQTSHVLVVDVDFVPSMDLHDTIQTILYARKEQRHAIAADIVSEVHDAIVVPAFERILTESCNTPEECAAYLKGNSDFIPKSIHDLRRCVEDKNCSVFQSETNWEGHFSTRSEAWLSGEFYGAEFQLPNNVTARRIRAIKCFDSLRYEPYVVIRWCPSSVNDNPKPMAPYYDERFYGYGKNKIEMISHLRFMGYQFSILPEGFIVHYPHPESVAKKTWNNVKDFKLHENMDHLYPQFLRELLNKYSNVTTSIIKQCEYEKKSKYKRKTESSQEGKNGKENAKDSNDNDPQRSHPHHERVAAKQIGISGDK